MRQRTLGEGVLYGELYASVFVAMATVAEVLSGGHIFDGSNFSYVKYVGGCIIGGAVGGIVYVFIEPLRRWWLGRALMGFMIGFPVMLPFAYMAFLARGVHQGHCGNRLDPGRNCRPDHGARFDRWFVRAHGGTGLMRLPPNTRMQLAGARRTQTHVFVFRGQRNPTRSPASRCVLPRICDAARPANA